MRALMNARFFEARSFVRALSGALLAMATLAWYLTQKVDFFFEKSGLLSLMHNRIDAIKWSSVIKLLNFDLMYFICENAASHKYVDPKNENIFIATDFNNEYFSSCNMFQKCFLFAREFKNISDCNVKTSSSRCNVFK